MDSGAAFTYPAPESPYKPVKRLNLYACTKVVCSDRQERNFDEDDPVGSLDVDILQRNPDLYWESTIPERT